MISILKTFLLHIFNVNIQYFNLKKQIIVIRIRLIF